MMSNQKLSLQQKHYIKVGCHSSSRLINDAQCVCVCVCACVCVCVKKGEEPRVIHKTKMAT